MKKKLLIITMKAHPYALFIISKLRQEDLDIFVVNQTISSKKNLGGLLKNRGFFIYFDNLLLDLYNKIWKFIRKNVISRIAPNLIRKIHQKKHSFFPDLVAIDNIRHDFPSNWFDVDSVNSPSCYQILEQISPDITMLAGAPILKRETIKKIGNICINAHYGIVPEYAGSDSPTWALFRRDWNKIGFTIHYVEPKVDGGAIIYQEIVIWDPKLSILNIGRQVAMQMYEKFVDIGIQLAKGEVLNAKIQNNSISRPPAGLIVQCIASINKFLHTIPSPKLGK